MQKTKVTVCTRWKRRWKPQTLTSMTLFLLPSKQASFSTMTKRWNCFSFLWPELQKLFMLLRFLSPASNDLIKTWTNKRRRLIASFRLLFAPAQRRCWTTPANGGGLLSGGAAVEVAEEGWRCGGALVQDALGGLLWNLRAAWGLSAGRQAFIARRERERERWRPTHTHTHLLLGPATGSTRSPNTRCCSVTSVGLNKLLFCLYPDFSVLFSCLQTSASL